MKYLRGRGAVSAMTERYAKLKISDKPQMQTYNYSYSEKRLVFLYALPNWLWITLSDVPCNLV